MFRAKKRVLYISAETKTDRDSEGGFMFFNVQFSISIALHYIKVHPLYSSMSNFHNI